MNTIHSLGGHPTPAKVFNSSNVLKKTISYSYGAGLVLQRTYNSNDARIGPFGVGRTHAAILQPRND